MVIWLKNLRVLRYRHISRFEIGRGGEEFDPFFTWRNTEYCGSIFKSQKCWILCLLWSETLCPLRLWFSWKICVFHAMKSMMFCLYNTWLRWQRWLFLGGNNIKDLAPLQNMIPMTELYLSNRGRDFTPLRDMTRLKFLDLSENTMTESDKSFFSVLKKQGRCLQQYGCQV